MKRKLILLGTALAAGALGADPAAVARGEKEEARTCIACHSLRIVHSQRLSKAAWGRELDKMAGWGTKVEDRDALIEYLAANFGDDKAPQPPVLTKDGSQQKK
jgi:mono/diheme cytochrome c family protein